MTKDDVKKLPVRNKRSDDGGLFLAPPPYDRCNHFNGPFEVDEDAGKCYCKRCGGEVSPIFVLTELMKKESLWNRSRERYNDEMRRLSNRSRTKCEHCGKMTQISRSKPRATE